jgi:hypothetical protein
MREEVAEWELQNEESLQQLASILHELIEFAATSKTGVEICRSEAGPLQIRRLAGDPPGVLPPKLKARWKGE